MKLANRGGRAVLVLAGATADVEEASGLGLARREGAAVLTALADRVGTITLARPPVRERNNLIRSFASLPVEVVPA